MSLKSKKIRAAALILSVAALTASSGDWPNFHGPDRTNRSTETGLLKSWPAQGPRLLWTASGIGEGYSGVSVVDGIIYTAGVKNKANYVFAVDLGGKILWEKQAGPAWEATRAFARAYQGTRSTPTVSGGMVYYLSDTGVLTAFDAKSGDQKWTVDLPKKYNAEMPAYGYSESPLVIGDRIYVAPYGARVTAVCLDRRTGNVIWESERVPGDGDYAGYASFKLVEHGGFRQLVSFTVHYVYSLNIENGKILWTVPFENNRRNNCTDIIYHDGHIFAASGYGRGAILIKLSPKSGGGVAANVVYDVKLMDNHHGGVIFHEGHVYGSGHESKGWFSLNFQTGAQRWVTPGKGSLTFADGMLYMYDEEGKMTLARATPERFTEISSFKVTPGSRRSQFWAHPVISNGVLYVRHDNNLYAYAVK